MPDLLSYITHSLSPFFIRISIVRRTYPDHCVCFFTFVSFLQEMFRAKGLSICPDPALCSWFLQKKKKKVSPCPALSVIGHGKAQSRNGTAHKQVHIAFVLVSCPRPLAFSPSPPIHPCTLTCVILGWSHFLQVTNGPPSFPSDRDSRLYCS